jgi:hypothetical protein
MSKRGRVSAAERNITVIEGTFGEKPAPPEELNADQAEIWRRIVASEPGDFFSTATVRDLLVDLCRHRETVDKISERVEAFKVEWFQSAEGTRTYALLLKMRDSEVRAITTLATKLRLTNQSRYEPNKAARLARDTVKGAKPWEL